MRSTCSSDGRLLTTNLMSCDGSIPSTRGPRFCLVPYSFARALEFWVLSVVGLNKDAEA
jgi:hypothetical protein